MSEYGRIHTDGSRSGGQPVLEPCPVPWCGSSDVKERSFDANHRRHWIECGKCNFKTPQMPSRTKVITLWNTRQPTQSDAEIIAENKRLREALKRIQHFSPAHMWRAPDIKVIISAALQEQSK